MSDEGSEDSGPRPKRKIKRVVVLPSSSESESDESIAAAGTRRKRMRVLSDVESDSSGSSVICAGTRRKRTLPKLRDSEGDSDTSGGWATDHSDAPKPAPTSSKPSTGFASDSSEGNSDKCSICLLRFTNQEVGTPESCEHIFCLDCITEWSKNVNTCPVDRMTFDTIVVRACAGGRVLRTEVVKVVERRPSVEMLVVEDPTVCEICGSAENEQSMLLCDGCDLGYHMQCLSPPLTEIPTSEWFCPNCNHVLDVIHLSEVEGLFSSLGDMEMPNGPRPSVLRQSREVRRSGRSTRALDQPSTSSGASRSSASTTSRSSAPNSTRTTTTRRRTTTTTTTQRRKYKRRRTKTVIIEYEVEENGKFPVTKRVKRRVKKRRISKRQPRTAARRSYVRASVRAALAGRGVAGGGEQQLGASRQRAGIPTLSLFGSSHQLDYFSEEEHDVSEGASTAAVAVRPTSRMLSAYRQARRKMISIPSPPHAAAAPDVLSSILESQTLLHSKNSVVEVTVDGSVNIKLQTRKEKPASGADNKKVDLTNGEECSKKVPSYPGQQRGGWGGGYRGHYTRDQTFNRAGYESGAYAPNYQGQNRPTGGPYQNNGGRQDNDNYSPGFQRRPFPPDDEYDRVRRPPNEHRLPNDHRPPNDHRLPIDNRPPNDHRLLGDNRPPIDHRPLNDYRPMHDHRPPMDHRSNDHRLSIDHRPTNDYRPQPNDQRQNFQQRPEQARHSVGPSWTPYGRRSPPARASLPAPAPAPPADDPLDMRVGHPPARRDEPYRPLPEPPVFKFDSMLDKSEDEKSDSGLVIDTEKYDPTEPTNDEDSGDEAVATPGPAPVTAQGAVHDIIAGIDATAINVPHNVLDSAVRQVLQEHRDLISAPIGQEQSDSGSDGDCPNFSIYSATSVHIANDSSAAETALVPPRPGDDLADLVQEDDDSLPPVVTTDILVKKREDDIKEKVSKRCPITTNPRNPIKIKLNTPSLIKRQVTLYDDEEAEDDAEVKDDAGEDTPTERPSEKDKTDRSSEKEKIDRSSEKDKLDRSSEKEKIDRSSEEKIECTSEKDKLERSNEKEVIEHTSKKDMFEHSSEKDETKRPTEKDRSVSPSKKDSVQTEELQKEDKEERSETPVKDDVVHSPKSDAAHSQKSEDGEISDEHTPERAASPRCGSDDDRDDDASQESGASPKRPETPASDTDGKTEKCPTEKTAEDDDDDKSLSPQYNDEISDEEFPLTGAVTPPRGDDKDAEGIEKMTESISETEDERSYTPCLDENKSKDTSLETDKDKALEGLDTEMISEDDHEMFSDDERERAASPAAHAASPPLPEKRKEKDKDTKDEGKKKKKKESKREAKKDKDKKKAKKSETTFKKLGKNGKERNYRDKDKDKRDSSEGERERQKRKRKEKRKDLERYDVRTVVSEKRRRAKDPFGRDVSPRRSRSPSLSPPERSPSPAARRRSPSPAVRRRSPSPAPRRRSPSPAPRRRSLSPASRRRSPSPAARRRSPSPVIRRRRSASRRHSPSPVRAPSPRRSASSPRRPRASLSPRSATPPAPRRRRSPERPRRRRSGEGGRKRRRSGERSPSPRPKSKAGKRRRRARSERPVERRKKSPKRRRLRRRSPPPPDQAAWSPPSINSRLLSPRTPPPDPPAPRRPPLELRRHRRARDNTAPSKEVFTSGDNILVSVSFKEQERTGGGSPEKRERRERRRERRRRRRLDAETEAVRPVAIIDLERSPFRELTPSPRNVIVLSDSEQGVGEPAPAVEASGPRTPVEPNNSAEPAAPAQEAEEARGPNTPPEPPSSPDAYDPFEPTRSPSASPAAPPPPAPAPPPVALARAVSPARPSITLETAMKTNLSADDVIDRRPFSPIEKVMALLQSTRDVSPEPPPGDSHQPPQALSPPLVPPAPAPSAAPPAPTLAALAMPRIVLPEVRPQPPKLFLAKPSPIKSDPIKPMQMQTKPRALPPPPPLLELGGDSPYSPGSSDFGELFEPPGRGGGAGGGGGGAGGGGRRGADVFDALLAAKPRRSRRAPAAAKVPVKLNKKKGKTQVGVKIDENNLKILDDLPSSAVEMQVKSKFLKKLNRQERVVEEVKLVLKPHYNKKHVTKEEYKDILRRTVPKICHNKSGEINPTKIQALVEAYVKKFRKKHKLGLA